MSLSENPFNPLPSPHPGIVTWIHIGDLHMVRAGEQNYRDLQSIVNEINLAFTDKGVSFVYLPGDIADDGSERAYSAVRDCLDRLSLPWCAVVGDHDVHEKSFSNFQKYMDAALHGAFTVGHVRFYRLNCFSEPRPDSFIVDREQLEWLEQDLQQNEGMHHVLLMHCYPSDLKEGGEELTALIHRFQIRLVDMGHTHYNEISNDGTTLYCATRSTGQVEEGPVGYSVITIDGGSVSWHFQQLGKLPLVTITSPTDRRLYTETGHGRVIGQQPFPVHTRVWDSAEPTSLILRVAGKSVDLKKDDAGTWQAIIPGNLSPSGSQTLMVEAYDGSEQCGSDEIQISAGAVEDPQTQRSELDQENALESWPERSLLGTQLGPNKNGRKW